MGEVGVGGEGRGGRGGGVLAKRNGVPSDHFLAFACEV